MNFERPSIKPTEQKQHSAAFQEFERKINKGEEIKTTELEQSLVDGEIREDEFKILALKLLEISAHIEERLVSAVKKIEEKNKIDKLTGLSTDLEPTLERLLKELNFPRGGEGQRPSNMQALMVIYGDLNKFKLLNDTQGHPVGDKALIEFASRLRAATREGHDFLFRSNRQGDEFALILPIETGEDVSVQSLRDIFYKLVKKVNAGLSIEVNDGATFDFSASMGYSVAIRGGMQKTAQELIAGADREMYKEKRMKKRIEKKS